MCILSGCDFLQNLRGVGLRKAQKSLSRYSTALFLNPRVSYWTGLNVLTSWKKFGKLVDAPKGVTDEVYILCLS